MEWLSIIGKSKHLNILAVNMVVGVILNNGLTNKSGSASVEADGHITFPFVYFHWKFTDRLLMALVHYSP